MENLTHDKQSTEETKYGCTAKRESPRFKNIVFTTFHFSLCKVVTNKGRQTKAASGYQHPTKGATNELREGVEE
jgi:hypothetical protein